MENVVECVQDGVSIAKEKWVSHAPPSKTEVLQIRLSLAHSLLSQGRRHLLHQSKMKIFHSWRYKIGFLLSRCVSSSCLFRFVTDPLSNIHTTPNSARPKSQIHKRSLSRWNSEARTNHANSQALKILWSSGIRGRRKGYHSLQRAPGFWQSFVFSMVFCWGVEAQPWQQFRKGGLFLPEIQICPCVEVFHGGDSVPRGDTLPIIQVFLLQVDFQLQYLFRRNGDV